MITKTAANINLRALANNFLQIQKLMPNQKILSMIKSNAYGHGVVPVAKILSKTNALGVASISEALQLREENINNTIIVMRGFLNEAEMQIFLNDPKIIASVYSIAQVELLEQYLKPDQVISIWLKIDTGMHRLGIATEDFYNIHKRLQKIQGVKKPFCLFSHLADADNLDRTFTDNQIKIFDALTNNFAGEKSLLNSAGILAYSNHCHDWIRPGLLLYGVSPFQDKTLYHDQLKNFQPVMNLQAKIIAIKQINQFDKVGYSCTYIAQKNMRIAIIAAGYGDGYPWHAKSGTPVLIRGEFCMLVGRVSMDMLAVDISHLKLVEIGDLVTLWGEGLPVNLVAKQADTISHELLTRMTPRVEYQYIS